MQKHTIKFLLLFSYFLMVCTMAFADVKEGFKKLIIYDYFRAKEIFYSKWKSNTVAASFGLSIIYARTDNPFSNCDSAFKYIDWCKTFYNLSDSNSKQKFNSEYRLNSLSIDSLYSIISSAGIQKINVLLKQKNEFAIQQFILQWSSHPSYGLFLHMRDSVLLQQCANTTSALKNWILTYPESDFINKAKQLLYSAEFKESCPDYSLTQFYNFIAQYPLNPYVEKAKDEIILLEVKAGNANGLYNFISRFPNDKRLKDVWREFFVFSVSEYTEESLKKFLMEYPAFPFKEELLDELEGLNLELFPVYLNEVFGFSDSTGNLVIPCIYSAAEPFEEGLASVSDSLNSGYINKKGKIVIPLQYQDCGSFYRGAARVQKNNQFFIINRNNEVLAGPYSEMGEINGEIISCKQNDKWGAVFRDGKMRINFKFESLGDFNEGLASAALYGRCGYIESYGFWAIENIYEWCGDFQNQRAKVKLKGKYGLIDNAGKMIIPCEFDFISDEINAHYMVVKNGLYGIYHRSGCLVRDVKYIYKSELKAESIIGKNYIRLVYPKSESLSDYNGILLNEPGELESIELPHASYSMYIKKRKKYLLNVKTLQTVYGPFDMAYFFQNGNGILYKNNKYYRLKDQKISEFQFPVLEITPLQNINFLIKLSDGIRILNDNLEWVGDEKFEKVELWLNDFFLTEKEGKRSFMRISDGKVMFRQQ